MQEYIRHEQTDSLGSGSYRFVSGEPVTTTTLTACASLIMQINNKVYMTHLFSGHMDNHARSLIDAIIDTAELKKDDEVKIICVYRNHVAASHFLKSLLEKLKNINLKKLEHIFVFSDLLLGDTPCLVTYDPQNETLLLKSDRTDAVYSTQNIFSQ